MKFLLLLAVFVALVSLGVIEGRKHGRIHHKNHKNHKNHKKVEFSTGSVNVSIGDGGASEQLNRDAPPGFTLLGTLDNPQNDIGLQYPVSLDDCSAMCLSNSACAGFVYVTDGSRAKECWPKTVVGANLNSPFPLNISGATFVRETTANSGLSWISSTFSNFLPTSPPGAVIASGGVVDINNVLLTGATLAGGSITTAGNGQAEAAAFLSTSAAPSATSTTWIVAANDGSGFTKMVEVQIDIGGGNVSAYLVSAGYVSPGMSMFTTDSINNAWASSGQNGGVTTCWNCPGYGINSLSISIARPASPPVPPAPAGYNLLSNSLDSPGSDLGKVYPSSFSDCANLCSQNWACQGFVFSPGASNNNPGTCWPKSKIGAQTLAPWDPSAGKSGGAYSKIVLSWTASSKYDQNGRRVLLTATPPGNVIATLPPGIPLSGIYLTSATLQGPSIGLFLTAQQIFLQAATPNSTYWVTGTLTYGSDGNYLKMVEINVTIIGNDVYAYNAGVSYNTIPASVQAGGPLTPDIILAAYNSGTALTPAICIYGPGCGNYGIYSLQFSTTARPITSPPQYPYVPPSPPSPPVPSLPADGLYGCFKRTYGRGAGSPASSCPSGYEKDGGLCYPTCAQGYYGVGPVCWQSCPSGFADTGLDCLKPSAYGRGAGYVLWDLSSCNNDNPQGCEKWGALYYPKCASGFSNFACCICSPNCPSGMTDVGISCAKNSYGRTAGIPLKCGPGQQLYGGICYPECSGGYQGIGPVCWQSSDGCPSNYPYSCGAFCTADKFSCTAVGLEIGVAVGQLVLDTAEAADCLVETIESAGVLAVCWIPLLYNVVSDIKDDVEFFEEHFTLC